MIERQYRRWKLRRKIVSNLRTVYLAIKINKIVIRVQRRQQKSMIKKARWLMAVERALKWCDKEIKSRQKGAVQVMKKCFNSNSLCEVIKLLLFFSKKR